MKWGIKMDKEVVELYLDDIIPNRFQPREIFNEEALKELSDSIKAHGVIQPIIVRKLGDKYEIIAGERRYKATAMAGLTKIPAIIRNLDDKEAAKVALLENLQRKDLTAIEEARTYQKILEIDNMTQEELGKTMGKSQAAIANKMRLLSLPDEIQEALLNEKISERHARSLLNLDTPEEQIKMLNKIIDNRLTVRELDNEIKLEKGEVLPVPNNVDLIEAGAKVEVLDNDNEIKIEPPEELDFNLDDKENLDLSIDDLDNTLDFSIDDKEETEEMKKIDKLLRTTKSYTLRDVVGELKTTVEKMRNKGFDIRVDEMDFENTYQIVVKIDKNR